jgi:NAD(P)-dependent dehydrogenase (short-subunit alcohol dehydrogenase family)
MGRAIALAFAREGAKVAVSLASKESLWVTGAAIPLDGGLSAY